jgi:hypothetical protein
MIKRVVGLRDQLPCDVMKKVLIFAFLIVVRMCQDWFCTS